MKHLQFSCSLWDEATALPHLWEHTIGSGHAPLALRGDRQQQLQECRKQLGFRHTRFHGLLCDEMGTLMDEKNELLYSFFNADPICDFLLSIGMKPFVELSFMPMTLTTGGKTVFHYGANVTPPKDYGQWVTLVSRLATHWVERYGIDDDVWAVRCRDAVTALPTNHVLPRHSIQSESVHLHLAGLLSPRMPRSSGSRWAARRFPSRGKSSKCALHRRSCASLSSGSTRATRSTLK